jgi:hypothetical protein
VGPLCEGTRLAKTWLRLMDFAPCAKIWKMPFQKNHSIEKKCVNVKFSICYQMYVYRAGCRAEGHVNISVPFNKTDI